MLKHTLESVLFSTTNSFCLLMITVIEVFEVFFCFTQLKTSDFFPKLPITDNSFQLRLATVISSEFQLIKNMHNFSQNKRNWKKLAVQHSSTPKGTTTKVLSTKDKKFKQYQQQPSLEDKSATRRRQQQQQHSVEYAEVLQQFSCE